MERTKQEYFSKLSQWEKQFSTDEDTVLHNIALGSLLRSFVSQDLISDDLIKKKYEWTKRQASKLVLSVLSRMYIAPVIIQKQIPNKFPKKNAGGKELLVDGYQRLYALASFFVGEHAEDDYPGGIPELANLEGPDAPLNGLTFDLLPEYYAQAFQSYRVAVVQIPSSLDAKNLQNLYQIIHESTQVHEKQRKSKQPRQTPRKKESKQKLVLDLEKYGPYIAMYNPLIAEIMKSDVYARIGPKRRKVKTLEEERVWILRLIALSRCASHEKAMKEQELLSEKLPRLNDFSESERKAELDGLKTEFLSVMRVAVDIFPEGKAFHLWKASNSGEKGWSGQVNEKTKYMVYCTLADLFAEGRLHSCTGRQKANAAQKALQGLHESKNFVNLQPKRKPEFISEQFEMVKECLTEVLG
jgi:hypothetical protein